MVGWVCGVAARAESAAETGQAPMAARWVLVSPNDGELIEEQEFSVVFPAPMVPPGQVDSSPSVVPVEMEPPLALSFVWRSASQGTAVLKETPRPGMTYTLKLRPGTKDVHGEVLNAGAEAMVLGRFETKPFSVSILGSDSERLGVRPEVSVLFSAKVKPADVIQTAYFLERQTRRRIPCEVSLLAWQPVGETYHRMELSPREPLLPGERFDLVVEGLRTPDGRDGQAYLQAAPVGRTEYLRVNWLGAYHQPQEGAYILASFNDVLDAATVMPDRVRVEPPVENIRLTAEGRQLRIDGAFNPAQRYVVTLQPEIQGHLGFGMKEPARWGATFGAKRPAVIMGDSILMQRASLGLDVSLVQVNAGPLRWTLSSVPPERATEMRRRVREFEEVFRVDLASGKEIMNRTTLLSGSPGLKEVASGEIPASAPDVEEVRRVKWRGEWDRRPLQGLYLLEVFGKDAQGRTAGNRALISFSEVALVEKRTPQQTLIRAARMVDGAPVGGLVLEWWARDNRVLAQARTDASGIAALPVVDGNASTDDRPFLLVAKDGAGIVAEQFCDQPLMEGSPSPYWGKSEDAYLRTLIVTDRNLYRPGDLVKIKGLVRRGVNETLAATGLPEEGKVDIFRDYSEPVTSMPVKVSSTGSWEQEWRIPENAPPGTYRISSESSGETQDTGAFIEVEDYRPPLFSVEMVPEPFTEGRAKARLRSTYFHGAPNASAVVRWKAVWMRDAWVRNEERDRLILSEFGSPEAFEVPDEVVEEGQTRLGVDGTVLLESACPFKELKHYSRGSLRWVASVTSIEGRSHEGAASDKMQFHAAIPGLATQWPRQKPGTLAVEALALDGQDNLLSGTPLEVAISHLTTQVVRERVSAHVSRYVNSTQAREVFRQRVESPAKLEVPLDMGGEYRVVVRVGEGRDAPSVSEIVYAEGAAEVPVENDTSLQLVSEKREWLPGESAVLKLESPVAGVAWVATESESLRESFFVPVTAGITRVEVPVRPWYAPNITVTAHILHPGGADALPSERFGKVEIKVRRPDIQLDLTPKLSVAKAVPGQKVQGDILITSAGQPVANAETTVWAVDEAVLQLGGWEPPTLLPFFYPDRAHRVATFSATSRYLRFAGVKSLFQKGFILGDGGDGPNGNTLIRRNFQALAFWKDKLRSDSNGRVHFDFVAPDNLTTFRVMGLAHTRQSQFGFGSTLLTLSKPFQLELALPRFLRAGDRWALRLLGRLSGKDSVRAPLGWKTSGFSPEGAMPNQFAVTSATPAVLEVPARVNAVPGGEVSVEVRSKISEELSDGLVERVPVKFPTIGRKDRLTGIWSAEMPKPSDLLPASLKEAAGTVELSVSTRPDLVTLLGWPSVVAYPHGCAEQVSSRMLVLTALRQLQRALPQPMLTPEEWDKRLEFGVTSIQKCLREDGFLTYWPGQGEPNLYVTLQAAWAIKEALACGVGISEELKKTLNKTLSRCVRSQIPGQTPQHAVFALALAANPKHADIMREWFLRRDRLTDEGRAWLALAMQAIRIDPEKQEQLIQELPPESPDRLFNPATFSSKNRAEALRWLAALRCAQNNGQLQTVLSELAPRAQAWAQDPGEVSTQEHFWRLMVLAERIKVTEGQAAPLPPNLPKPDAVSQDNTAASWTVPIGALAKRFPQAFAPPSAPGSWVATVDYRLPDPEQPQDRGMRLERQLVNLTQAERVGTAEAPLHLGDQIMLVYRLHSSASGHYAALEDPLPAGFEWINPRLNEATAFMHIPEISGGTPLILSHSELRDDKALLYFDRIPQGVGHHAALVRVSVAGEFRWPGPQVSLMYQPGRGAVGGASTLHCVKAKE
jgi:uncharacterized protein YfaS (alpha-2-macroglobulin family)